MRRERSAGRAGHGARRRRLVALACWALGALASAPALAQDVVKVGSALDLVPFTFTDASGRPAGFELQLLELVGERLGLRFEYIKTPFAQAFTGLAAGKYRLNASAIGIRCERIAGAGKVGRFTVPTFSQGYVLSSRAGHGAPPDSFEALRGLRVGLESRGSTADVLADAHRERVGFTKVVFDNSTSLFLALQQGRVDAALQSQLVSRHLARTRPDVVVGRVLPGTATPAGFLFRDGDGLRDRFNEAIDALKRSGAVARLHERWFGVPPDPGSDAADVVPEVTSATCRSMS